LSILHAIVLGVVQGLSEFLPISSSGHLILVPELFHWHELTRHPALNKTFDVALHLGTLIAALWYFRGDLFSYVRAAGTSIRARAVRTTEERLAWLLLLSAIPGAIAGALCESNWNPKFAMTSASTTNCARAGTISRVLHSEARSLRATASAMDIDRIY